MLNVHSLRAVAISGSPSGTSRSRLLLHHVVKRLAREGVLVDFIDLALIPADDLLGRARSSAITRALTALARAQIVVVGTPVYRASYSGLLKVFFDLLPPSALNDKAALPIATGGSAGHQLVLDHAMRPLLASVGALVVSSGVFSTDAHFGAHGPSADVLERLERATQEVLRLAGASTLTFSPGP